MSAQQLDEYWRAFRDERREAIDRIVARQPKPRAWKAVVQAIREEVQGEMRPLVAVEVELGPWEVDDELPPADDEPTSPGRPAPRRAAQETAR